MTPPTAHRAAVLGHPIAHSLSPTLHRAAYAQSHTLWQERNALREAVETLRLANLRLAFEVNLHRLHSRDKTPAPQPGDGVQVPETLLRKLLTLCHPDKWDQGQPATALAHELTVEINRLRHSGRGYPRISSR